nr:TRCF domain-containing protein [Bacillus subtilis]
MVKEGIEEGKGETGKREEFEREIDVEVDGYIGESYIEEGKEKIDMYKGLRCVGRMEEKNEVEDEMMERFGNYGKEVE